MKIANVLLCFVGLSLVISCSEDELTDREKLKSKIRSTVWTMSLEREDDDPYGNVLPGRKTVYKFRKDGTYRIGFVRESGYPDTVVMEGNWTISNNPLRLDFVDIDNLYRKDPNLEVPDNVFFLPADWDVLQVTKDTLSVQLLDDDLLPRSEFWKLVK